MSTFGKLAGNLNVGGAQVATSNPPLSGVSTDRVSTFGVGTPGDPVTAGATVVPVIFGSNGDYGGVPGTPVVLLFDEDVGDVIAVAARANDSETTFVVGVAGRPPYQNSPAEAPLVTGGRLVLTTAEWDARTGDSGGLVAGSPYYLSSSVAGKLTRIAPTEPGTFKLKVGVAGDSVGLVVQIGDAILNGGG